MARKKKAVEEIKEEVVETPVEETKKTRRKKTVKEEVVVETPVEEVAETAPVEETAEKASSKEVVDNTVVTEEIKAEEVNPELTVPEMPETFETKKKDYNVSDIIRKYIGCETARIYEGDLCFNNAVEYNSSRYNVIIGNLDLRKLAIKINILPKVIFGDLIVNKASEIPPVTFLGGKIIKK